jgi:hypothetical protein
MIRSIFRVRALLLLCACLSQGAYAACDFGYISYSSFNIGDDIQSLAAKAFLPAKSIAIDREFVGDFKSDTAVATIMNGWFMHTKNFDWYLRLPPPEKSWPPPASIDPLLISLHFAPEFLQRDFTPEAVTYLKEHGPVGARDLFTLQELQKRNIPAYFSGCLTLTLERTTDEKEDIIYAVDLDPACVAYLKEHTKSRVVTVTHRIPTGQSHEARLALATALLDRYQKAKCVITSRFHASMPCLGLQVPVLMVSNYLDMRFMGNKDLLHHCTKVQFLSGQSNFDFDQPPENPKNYLPLRAKLQQTVRQWVTAKSAALQPPQL